MKKVYKAKLRSLPAQWNTFHYVVDIWSKDGTTDVVYFSEAAQGKPIDVEINQDGYVVFDGLVHSWSNEPVDSFEVNDDYEDRNLENWFAL